MSERTRALLGACTCVVVVFLVLMGGRTTPLQYCASVVALCVLLALASGVGGGGVADAFEAFDEGVQAIPKGFYDAISPSLMRLSAVVRGDKDVDHDTVDLVASAYSGAADAGLHAADGTVDAAAFSAMKLQYKHAVVLLCRMKSMAPAAHDALLVAMGGCPPAPA